MLRAPILLVALFVTVELDLLVMGLSAMVSLCIYCTHLEVHVYIVLSTFLIDATF